MKDKQKFNIKVDDFLRILRTINRFSEDAIVKTGDNIIYSSLILPGGSAIIYTESSFPDNIQNYKMNLQGINRLISVLSNIPKSTDISLQITSNAILHDANGYKFKFHMLDDGNIIEAKITPDQVKNMKANHYINIESSMLSNILKSSTFIRLEKVKCYFEVENGRLLCTLTDKSIPNADEFSVVMSENFTDVDIGTGYICDIDYLRKITYVKDSMIQIGFANRSMHFEIAHENGLTKYVYSMLIE